MSDHEDGDHDTDRASTRWKYTNDLVLGALVLGYFAMIATGGYGLLDLQAIPWYVIVAGVTFVGIGIAWAFGPEAVAAWNEAKMVGGEEGDG